MEGEGDKFKSKQASKRYRTLRLLTYSLALVLLIPSWLVLAEIESTLHVDLPKRPLNWFQPVLQNRQQGLTAYCPSVFTVLYKLCLVIANSCSNHRFQSECHDSHCWTIIMVVAKVYPTYMYVKRVSTLMQLHAI